MTPAIRLRGLSKSFGDAVAVQPTDLEVHQNEFFSILGPSGCGKTTLMRMIAGLEAPTTGSIELDGKDVEHAPTRDRDLNMVFQSYALFPHLSVAENVAFELKVRYGSSGRRLPQQLSGRRIEEHVAQALELVRLGPLARRRPDQLSGGQRQRVALARAIVSRPAVVLLDEPLGALDQKLRKEMQFELMRLQREVGITFVYVTHDQEEALTMSDRVAVMSAGRVRQIGSPADIYHHPSDMFVAGFIGTCNLVPVRAASSAGLLPDGSSLPAHAAEGGPRPGDPAVLAVRPEAVRLAPCDSTDDSLTDGPTDGPADGSAEAAARGSGVPALVGNVREFAFIGHEWRVVVSTRGAGELTVTAPARRGSEPPRMGAAVQLSWDASDALLVAPES